MPAKDVLEFTCTLPLRHDKTAPSWEKWRAGLLIAGFVALGIGVGFCLGWRQRWLAELTINSSFQFSHALVAALLVSIL
ncbi:MAG: hypothetical protein AAB289_06735, partial [Chloroflexota bacterium]